MGIRLFFKKCIEQLKLMFVGKQLMVSILLFSSMILIFPSGALLKSTSFEQYGLTSANIAKKNTANGDYLSLLITSNKSEKMPTGFFETHELNGIFRGNNFNFATTVNSNKKQKITISEFSNDVNFSILYANTFSNRVYEDHYRHEYYPLELMFKGDHSVDKEDYSFCYISKSQANILLEKMSLEKNHDNYENLLRTKIDIEYDGIVCKYSIANIYLETNPFYDGLKSTMGDFVVTYAKHPDTFKQTYNYYLNIYPFQNTYFLERIASIYNSAEYSVDINYTNVTKTFSVKAITGFFTNTNTNTNHVISIVFIAITFLIFALSLILLYLRKVTITLIQIFVYPSLSIFAHFLFRIIYVSTNTAYCFSNFSTVSFLIMNIILISYLVILFILKRRRAIDE